MSADQDKSADGHGRLDPQARAELKALAAIFAEARAGSGPDRHPLATTTFPAVREDGTIAGFPWTEYDPAIERFWSMVRRLQLCADPFDWPAWLDELRAAGADPLDPELVAGLTLPDLRRYLTALERVERFSDGTWRAALDRGVFEAVLRRILVVDRQG